jgi:chromosome partitioning protein
VVLTRLLPRPQGRTVAPDESQQELMDSEMLPEEQESAVSNVRPVEPAQHEPTPPPAQSPPSAQPQTPVEPQQTEPVSAPPTTRVIVFANQKGGVAKTTTTLNLGVALAEQGKRVLAIDLDPQGNLTMSQGWNPDEIERSMFDVLVHRLPITEIIRTNEIDVGVSSIDLAGAELALAAMIGRERALEKALAPVKENYDFILIDTPPSLGLLTINAFVAAQGVIVPVQCEYLSLRGLVQLENTLTMIRENLNPEVAIQGILPTMFDKRLLHSREAVEILKENFGDLVLRTKIKKTVRYAEAPVKGQSILKYDPSGDAADMYRDLAKEVLRGTS